ncbi:MAG: hypothetical protein JWQ03_2269 [Variovorax sp.]|nr:hypothetical protein [Variovorax sp.]
MKILLPLCMLLLCLHVDAAQAKKAHSRHPTGSHTVRQGPPPSPGMKAPPTLPSHRTPGFMDDGASKRGGRAE